MAQLILNIKSEKKISFIKEVLSAFNDYVEVVDKKAASKLSSKEKRLLEGIDESVDFINKYDKKTQQKMFE